MTNNQMNQETPIYIGEDVFQALGAHLQAAPRLPLLLVADRRTFSACGERLEDALRAAALPLTRLILEGEPGVKPDERSVTRALQALGGQERTLIALGSGTITDIVRFVAFQSRCPFVSVPTAASVDAYASYTTSITLDGLKHSFSAKTPAGVYAHLPTLCAAPPRMAASGFSDMLAKYTALADWRLASLLNGDAYDGAVDRRAAQALETCASQAAAIRAARPAGIAALMDSLIVSGHCMVAVKSSRPAAGAEHSLAHFWEMIRPARPQDEPLHGERTGAAAVVVAGLYKRLRALTRAGAARRLERFTPPAPEHEIAAVRAAYGPLSAHLLAGESALPGSFWPQIGRIQERLLASWDEVQQIAAGVPAPADIAALLETAGSVSHPSQLGISNEEIGRAVLYAMYVRDRFTILELNRMLSLYP